MGIRNKEVVVRDEHYHILREVDMPDGSTIMNAYKLPVNTLAIRAGEYGLDPNDLDLLLDCITYELDPSVQELHPPVPLWEEDTIKGARDTYLKGIAERKASHEKTGACSGTSCPVRKKIKESHKPNQDLVDLSRANAKLIWHAQRGIAPDGSHPLTVSVPPEQRHAPPSAGVIQERVKDADQH
jgi:hypothetical protein